MASPAEDLVDVDQPPPSPTDSQPTKRFKKRSGTTRVRTGCLTCRQRRKKCVDNTYPICGHCRRLNLECVREKPRQLAITSDPAPAPIRISSDDEVTQQMYTVRSPTLDQPMIPNSLELAAYTGGQPAAGDRRYLLKYYTQILASLLSTNHENNSFLSVFLPMAVESPTLRNCLVAWSSTHLSKFQPSYHILAMEQLSGALRSVSYSLASGSDDPISQETNLAACLVLCSTEVVRGDTSQWHKHLMGAKQIIISAQRQGSSGRMISGPNVLMNTMDGEWLLRNFAYHDVLGCVTTGDEPLIKGPYWLHDDVEIVDSYMGVGSRLLAMISEINYVRVPLEICQEEIDSSTGTYSTTGIDEKIWPALVSIEQRLQCWDCPAAVQAGLVAMAESYRGAALIYVYRKMRQCIRLMPSDYSDNALVEIDTKIQEQATYILSHLDFIPLSSLPECGLLFPLFMAGGDSSDPAQLELIQTRLQMLFEQRGFGNIQRGIDVLEELWRLRSCGIKGRGGHDVDWSDVLERTGMKLNLA